MNICDVIAATRDGVVSAGQVEGFVAGVVDGSVSDAQVGAWLMAVRCRGLSVEATAALCGAMTKSGVVLEWGDGLVVDKHSTGGVGDKVSLVLAPLLAAAGFRVPMLSGRSLGFTGGTLDKLEALPGFTADLGVARARRQLDEVGCFIAAAGGDVAPADRRLYGLRDVTATVDSVPLIAASILSKKAAAGVGRLVLDVKWGEGAFMGTVGEAGVLARTLVEMGGVLGLEVAARLTPMLCPLGWAVGNACEVQEALAVLGGECGVVRDLTLELGYRLAGLAGGVDAGRLEGLLDSGVALGVFERMCEAQGVVSMVPVGGVFGVEVRALWSGVGEFSAAGVAAAAAAAGATRVAAGGRVDLSAGVVLFAAGGVEVRAGDVVAEVCGADRVAVERAGRLVAGAWREWRGEGPAGVWVV